MTEAVRAPSPRREELLERAYAYALEHGLADLSLRPLAAAVGSSPRVLLYLFCSKDGLLRALLARARADELDLLARAGFA
ncbi:MAG: TetR family transcriptional regulator, partial [Actinomycetes bacterium]